jgi:phospholipid-binding lipoprotein MlaA
MNFGVEGVRAINLIVAKARFFVVSVSVLVSVGCASVPGGDPRDPWEGFNRPMTDFNEALDKAVVKPVATAYKAVTPTLVRMGVSNFFRNWSQPLVAFNAALQLNGTATFETLVRFGINTFMGLGGLIDVASDLNIERYQEDLGKTLGVWGIGTGPYLVLPLFGPSTLRDALAFGIETKLDPINNQSNPDARDSLVILRLIDLRASILKAGDVLDEAALDKYTFYRDVYLQRRDNLVQEGREPPANDEAPTK